jgi:hypothetical protein
VSSPGGTAGRSPKHFHLTKNIPKLRIPDPVPFSVVLTGLFNAHVNPDLSRLAFFKLVNLAGTGSFLVDSGAYEINRPTKGTGSAVP